MLNSVNLFACVCFGLPVRSLPPPPPISSIISLPEPPLSDEAVGVWPFRENTAFFPGPATPAAALLTPIPRRQKIPPRCASERRQLHSRHAGRGVEKRLATAVFFGPVGEFGRRLLLSPLSPSAAPSSSFTSSGNAFKKVSATSTAPPLTWTGVFEVCERGLFSQTGVQRKGKSSAQGP